MWDRIRTIVGTFFRKDLIVGKYTYGRPKIIRYGTEETAYIGKYCSIARNVTFMLTGNHRVDWISDYPFPAFSAQWNIAKNIKNYILSKGDIVVGNDVWIGYGSFILSGITIGDGAIIGAYSVVTKDIPPYTIVGGNPAKIIRKRFSQQQISRLLKLKWWNLPEEKIHKLIPCLCSDINSLKNLENESKNKN